MTPVQWNAGDNLGDIFVCECGVLSNRWENKRWQFHIICYVFLCRHRRANIGEGIANCTSLLHFFNVRWLVRFGVASGV